MALVINPDGTGVVRGERKGPSALAGEIGLAIAEELLGRGADRIIRALSGTTLEPPAAP
jgi:hydroxymethylbilane synthase